MIGQFCVLALSLLLPVATVSNLAAQQQQRPWTKEQVIRMLKGDVPPKRVAELARVL